MSPTGRKPCQDTCFFYWTMLTWGMPFIDLLYMCVACLHPQFYLKELN